MDNLKDKSGADTPKAFELFPPSLKEQMIDQYEDSCRAYKKTDPLPPKVAINHMEEVAIRWIGECVARAGINFGKRIGDLLVSFLNERK